MQRHCAEGAMSPELSGPRTVSTGNSGKPVLLGDDGENCNTSQRNVQAGRQRGEHTTPLHCGGSAGGNTVMNVKQTPLHATHESAGATFTEFAGWRMPLWYDSETREHNAVRTAVAMFDLSHMGEIEVEGPGAGEALDYALVGKPSAIAVGSAKYMMLCDLDGGVIDDLVVYRLDAERFLIVANASNTDCVVHVLRHRTRGYDASVDDASDAWSLIAVQGPRSAAVVEDLSNHDTESLRYYGIDRIAAGPHDVLIARTGYTGEDGFEIYCTPDDAPSVWNLIMGAGKRHGIRPAGLACRDTLRLEAGMPLFGHELDRKTSPFDAGLGRVVDFNKDSGFVGDRALRARRAQGAHRKLVGLTTKSRRSPRPGYIVVDPVTGESVGRVTSGAPAPTLGHPIAMAYVDASLAEPGTRLSIVIRGSEEQAEVVQLPFYSRTRSQPKRRQGEE